MAPELLFTPASPPASTVPQCTDIPPSTGRETRSLTVPELLSIQVSPPASEVPQSSDTPQSITERDLPSLSSPITWSQLTFPPQPAPVVSPDTGRERPSLTAPEWLSIPTE